MRVTASDFAKDDDGACRARLTGDRKGRLPVLESDFGGYGDGFRGQQYAGTE
jgi:hypothetical protein